MIKTFLEAQDFLNTKLKHHSPQVIKEAIEKLDISIDKNKVILVAGTNGKGTVASTLEYLLMASGRKVGFFSSPHLIRINERINVNAEDISDEDFLEIFLKIHGLSQKYDFSYFEYLTLIAVYYFFEIKKVDYAIFEVGLGGLWDATNAIDHQTSIITKLGMDHEAKLGSTLEEIAQNKFGIIKPQNDVFFERLPNEEIKKLLYSYPAKFFEAENFYMDVIYKNNEPIFKLKNRFGVFALNLPGRRACENTNLSQLVFNHLIKDASKYMNAVLNVKWPARMEKLQIFGRDVYFSGDHNPQGIESLLEIVDFYRKPQNTVHFVVGICRDKSHKRMIRKLFDCVNSEIYLTETPNKTLFINEYEDSSKNQACYLNKNPIFALKEAISNAKKDDLIVVTGSLYLVGFFYKFLE